MTSEKVEDLEISPEIAKELHLQMVRTRIFEERVREALFNNEIQTPCHLYLGEEAVAAGVCVNLEETDNIFSNHRSHGHYIAKGGDLNLLMAEIYARETKKAGSFGFTSIFSFYPAKVLGTAGDGGMLCTNDEEVAIKVRELRDNGRTSTGGVNGYGYCSRLDNLHAALLDVKLKHVPAWIERRREIAALYKDGLNDFSELHLPHYNDNRFFDVYQNYVVQTAQRDEFVKYLRESGIEILVSWPTPMHKQQSLGLDFDLPMTDKISNTVLSLPMYPELSNDGVQTVIDAIRGFFKA